MKLKNEKLNNNIRELIILSDCDCMIDRLGYGEGNIESLVIALLDKVEEIIDATDPSVKGIRHEPFKTIIHNIYKEFGVE